MSHRTGEPALAAAAVLGVLAIALTGCSASGDGGADPNGAVYDAWRNQQTKIEVGAAGSVARVLGSRRGPSGEHEGFLLHLRGAAGHGLTVRVEDNEDITGPIPLHAGDDVTVRGEYIYDPRGGIIHYTHHDPRFRHAGGYVKIGDKIYQ
jgi:Protein of unknown function (DUF3465)